MRPRDFPFLYLVFLHLLIPSLSAEVSLPAIFGDHMVLQQGMTLPVWGTAAPGESVTVSFSGRRASTKADASGRWRVTLRPLPSSFSPQTLLVKGLNTLEIRDVLVGEVWVAAGEGNMKQSLSDAWNGGNEAAVANDRALRFFTVARSAGSLPDHCGSGEWVSCTPESAAAFSATGYFFARDLRATQRIPVGIISCAVNGAPLSAWVSRRGLRSSPSILPTNARVTNPETAPSSLFPSSLFNGMIAPLIPLAISGVIWDQGESDRSEGALGYRRLFQRLIRDWREAWGEGPFPFYFTCLAGMESGEEGAMEKDSRGNGKDGKPVPGLSWIREGQSQALSLPLTGMAVATDLGTRDVAVHPFKLELGRRLALLARHRVYGEKIADTAPVYRSFHVKDGKITVMFGPPGTGLTISPPPRDAREGKIPSGVRLMGFSIAGRDGKWFPAEARILGTDSVVVWSENAPSPVAVRYDWQEFPTGNLYSKEGLPVAPFRSDREQPK
jgi:sialate O-acetylesterase